MSKRTRVEDDNSNSQQKKKLQRNQEAPQTEEKFDETVTELKLSKKQEAYYTLLLSNISNINLTDLKAAIPDATTLNNIERGQSNFLCAATQYNRDDIVEYLLDICKANPTVPNSKGSIPVIEAADNGNADILGLMFERVDNEYHAFQDVIDDIIAEDIAEALISALLRGDRDIANFLLKWSSADHIVNLLKEQGSNAQVTKDELLTAWPLLSTLIIEQNGLVNSDDKPAETTETASTSSSSSMYQQHLTSPSQSPVLSSSSTSVTTSGIFGESARSSSRSSESASSRETTSSTTSTSSYSSSSRGR